MKLHVLFLSLLALILCTACANMGNPDGGPYDETPPTFIDATTPMGGSHAHSNRIKLFFNEYIKVENAAEKVIVSPPQLNLPEITVNGREIMVKLLDSLRANTTYTIDFSDAITDNNEGNPMGQFTYYFSTGAQVDTLEISGIVLQAEDLEPIKGVLVGVHRDFADSAFTRLPFERVARTNAAGRFNIKGVAPGKYRIFALKDADGNFRYTQKSELIAVGQDTISPSFFHDVRTDTTWIDSTHIDSIALVHYTHFTPDNVILRAFTAVLNNRYLAKTQRNTPQFFDLFFTAPSTVPVQIHGLNFDAKTALLTEANATNDTLRYWVRDTTAMHLDTLAMAITYEYTDDSTQLRRLRTDTLELAPKTTIKAQRLLFAEKVKKWEKDKNKAEKQGAPFVLPYPSTPMQITYRITNGMSPINNPSFTLATPSTQIDTTRIHLWLKVDTVRSAAAFKLLPDSTQARTYRLFAAWRPGQTYQLSVDDAAFTDIYNNQNAAYEASINVGKAEAFGTLFVNLKGIDSTAYVQLLQPNGKVGRSVMADSLMRAAFYYVTPGDYYLRTFIDVNHNGVWDSGDYEAKRQPEPVYYFPQNIKIPAKWDVEQTWNPTLIPLDNQKPAAITKQKPDKKRTIQKRNAERNKAK